MTIQKNLKSFSFFEKIIKTINTFCKILIYWPIILSVLNCCNKKVVYIGFIQTFFLVSKASSEKVQFFLFVNILKETSTKLITWVKFILQSGLQKTPLEYHV